MVYYHTSANVKMLRNIIMDYEDAEDMSPYEYMQVYIEKCPESIEDTKLSWIAETFLSFQKHQEFLKEISSHLSEGLSNEEQDYFMIIFHAVIFRIEPKDMQYLYKCLFNLCKPLLNTFTKFLSNNELLTFISQVAQAYYDTNYITDKIIGPLFQWQPYISEMAHSYAEYVKKIENRRLKLPTIPIQMNVLNRRSREVFPTPSQQPHLPATPPNSVHNKKKRMLTKNTIDQKLKILHEKNKQKAAHLLNDIKSKDYHYAQTAKPEKYSKKLANVKEMEDSIVKSNQKPRHNYVLKHTPHVQVKETATTVKRLKKRIQMQEDEEVQWLQNVICYRNTTKIEEIAEHDRQERERERLLDIERKHLRGLITYEEAVLAKKKVVDENKKKYEDFVKEKQLWNEKIEKYRKSELEENRKKNENRSIDELNVLQAKNELSLKKREHADLVKKESEEMIAMAMKKKQEELDRRIKLIKELKILEIIAKKAKVPRILDLTDTANFGLLCEMSIAELQERLAVMKMEVKDELERKKKTIREEKEVAKQNLEDAKNSITDYMKERAQIRKQNKKINQPVTLNRSDTKNINDLKKILDEKRSMRLKLCNPLPL